MGPYSTVLIKRLTSMKGLVGTSKAAAVSCLEQIYL